MAINFNSNTGNDGVVKHVVFQKNGTSSKAGRLAFGKKSNSVKNYFSEQLTYNDTTDQIADLLPCFDSVAIFAAKQVSGNNRWDARLLIALRRSNLTVQRSETYKISDVIYYGERLFVYAVVRSGYTISKKPAWVNTTSQENFDALASGIPWAIANQNFPSQSYPLDATTTTLPSNINTTSSSFNFNNLFPATQFTYTGPYILLALTMDSSIESITVNTKRYQYSFLSTDAPRTLNRNETFTYAQRGSDTFGLEDEFEPGDVVTISVTVISSLGSTWYMKETSCTWIVGGDFTGNSTGTVYLTNAWQASAAFAALSYANLQARTLKFIPSADNNASVFEGVSLLGGVQLDIYNASTHETSTKSCWLTLAAGWAWSDNGIALTANEFVASGFHFITTLSGTVPSGTTVRMAIQYGNQVQETLTLTVQPLSGGEPIRTYFDSISLGYINYPADNTSSDSGGSLPDIVHPGDHLEHPWEPGGGGIIITDPGIGGGGGGGGGCVERNTPIMVSVDGETQPACDLRTGGMIVGWKDGKIIPTKIIQKYVARKINQFVRIYLSNKTFLEVTPNHPVLCDDGVYRAYNSKDYEKLTVDHKIQTINGIVDIESLDLIELEPETVINFLTETDNFIATEVIVGAESPDVKGILVKDQFGRTVDVNKSVISGTHVWN